MSSVLVAPLNSSLLSHSVDRQRVAQRTLSPPKLKPLSESVDEALPGAA